MGRADDFCLEQVFVANPNKPKPIVEILTGNQEKLLKYLTNFHTDKGIDLVIRITINLLGPPSTIKYLPDYITELYLCPAAA